jgi:hypothetical protein
VGLERGLLSLVNTIKELRPAQKDDNLTADLRVGCSHKPYGTPWPGTGIALLTVVPISYIIRGWSVAAMRGHPASTHRTILQYFPIDNAHLIYNAYPNIFITPFKVQITRIRQLAVELGSIDRGRRNSLKARVLLVVIAVILSLMKNFLDLNSLMFDKY